MTTTYLACKRTTGPCVERQPHNAHEHLDPRHPLYDGPSATIGALPSGPCRAARALLSAGAPVPEVVELANEIHRLRDQAGHLMVDKDRAVRAAMDRALDCEAHGKDIEALNDQLGAVGQQSDKHDRARSVLAVGILNYQQQLEEIQANAKRGAKVSTDEILDALIKGLKRLGAQHDRAMSR